MYAVGVFAVPYFVMQEHSVALYRLERVKLGSTVEDVRSVLGGPSSVAYRPNGDEWLYSGPTWCHVRISFDTNQVVDYIDHDH